MERVGGIEPPSLAWKARVIPLYDTREISRCYLGTLTPNFIMLPVYNVTSNFVFFRSKQMVVPTGVEPVTAIL